MSSDPTLVGDQAVNLREDLRQRTSAWLIDHLDHIAADTITTFSFSGPESLDVHYCNRVGLILVQLLAQAVRDGGLDSSGALVANLHRVLAARGLPTARLFTFVSSIERAALDELATDAAIGATTEGWAMATQLIRRASFDVLAACNERAQLEPNGLALTDRLTTLYTRPLFDVVLRKELLRAGRFGEAVSLILVDVDRLSEINTEQGYQVGDRVLERLGIVIRQYFRQDDWVARHSEDSIAVLVSRTAAEHANELAERVRHTVETRLRIIDHRTDREVAVTVSVGVVNLNIGIGDVIDAERLLAEAEAAVQRAKQHGRNRVERLDGLPRADV